VRALRAHGHVVGFMGAGINDAPALRAADIGISVDSTVDIAKDAADIILLEKSLLVLDEGVVQGRCNMLKYIRMTASSNFGNVLSAMVASAFLPFLPMLPLQLQLLVQNLLYDIAQTAIPFDSVDDDLVRLPLRWKHFKLQPLPPPFFVWLAAILLGYAGLATWVKRHHVRRFGWQ
jgi:P-type Mg2+ transporter